MAAVEEQRLGAVATLTLNRPERRNALSLQMRRELLAALERIEADRDVRAVVLTGAAGNFCSGGDMAELDVPDLTAGRARFDVTHAIVRKLVKSARPVIAAVEGGCAGAGLSLALCCDTVVAADNAVLAASFVKVGLIPDLGLTHTLPLRVGEGKARQILFYGRPVDAGEALGIGLVDRVVPVGAALSVALEIASRAASLPPLPLAAMKARLAHGLEDTLDWEREVQAMLFLSSDHAEGKAAFLEKRAALFRGA